jgi:hypothetical protein
MDREKENKTERKSTITAKIKRSKGKYEIIKKVRANRAKTASEGRDYGDDYQERK